MRKLALALLCLLMITGAVLAGTITPDLTAKLESSPPTELVPIMVTMNQQRCRLVSSRAASVGTASGLDGWSITGDLRLQPHRLGILRACFVKSVARGQRVRNRIVRAGDQFELADWGFYFSIK